MFQHPPRLHFLPRDRRRPEPSQIDLPDRSRTPGSGSCLDAQRADEPGPSGIDLDMEFAQEGGEGATPYEVLLHAALIGDSTHFTRQDSVEECWRIVQPLLDAPPPVDPLQRRLLGPDGGRGAAARLRRLAQAVAAVSRAWVTLLWIVIGVVLRLDAPLSRQRRHAEAVVSRAGGHPLAAAAARDQPARH